MLLADMGAQVIRVDRTIPGDVGVPSDPRYQLLNRGRRSIAIDLKQAAGVDIVKKLIEDADIFVEGFRPGVAERMGLAPDACLAINPQLVYGRMTGWGQDGPLAQAAGHDINYISLTGVLDSIGTRNGPPVAPMNLVGDFGGGALYLAFGVACALNESQKSGIGQVVDSSIVDGSAHLMTSVFGMMARNDWSRERGRNLVAGGKPWYGVYKTLDQQYISIGAVEERFYQELLERTGLNQEFDGRRDDPASWPLMAQRLETIIGSRTRDEWTQLLEGSDTCFAPVLNVDEAQSHPHIKARQVFVESHGVVQPAPAPRFSRTPTKLDLPPPSPGQHTRDILLEWGYTTQQIEMYFKNKIIA